MKCSNCILGKEIDENTTECCNMSADDYGYKLFTKWDGCGDGKASMVGMTPIELFSLQQMGS